MTIDPAISDRAGAPRYFARWGLRNDVVCLWGLYCACYWLYPLWPRGNVSLHAKFAVLAVYTVVYVVLLGFWNRGDHSGGEDPARATWRTALTTPWGVASVAVLVTAAALQFHETLLPVLSGPDEPYRIVAAIDQWSAITGSGAGAVTTMAALASPILVWLGGLILLSDLRSTPKRLVVGCGVLIAGLALNHQTMLEVGGRWGGSPRWPPLGTLFEVFSFSLFGLDEAAARLPSLLFFVLTGVVVLCLVARESPAPAAFVGVVSILSSPAFFTQGQLASRETMGAFFMTAAAYFLVRRWHGGRVADLGWAITLALAAYLTRRPAIVFFAVIVAVEAVRLWRQRSFANPAALRQSGAQVALGGSLCIAGAFPWMFATRTIRPFELSPGNWLDWNLIIAYPVQFPVAMGVVVTALGVVGVAAAVVHRRVLATVALVWLAGVYLLFTSDVPEWIPTWRFLAMMSPAWALLAAEGFRYIDERLPKAARPIVTAVVVIGGLASVVMWLSCGSAPAWLAGGPCRAEIPRYPYDQVVGWIGDNAQGPVTLTPATYWQTSLDVYAAFEGVDGIAEYVPPYGSAAPPLRLSDISDLCRSQPIDLVVVPWQRQGERWVPKFMELGGEESSMFEIWPGVEDPTVFTSGRFRLEVLPCPSD
jgi:hypothetical protein